MVYVNSDTKINYILTVYRNQSVESESVEIFVLSLTIFELERNLIFRFLRVLTCSDLS
jgi:hypothetical protein